MKKEKHRKMHGNSAQSAMEYLMTYGWAILIIAVVLAILFSLGLLNPLFYTPKAVAGSCQVVRPNGPDTIQSISLEGGSLCAEIPEYVADFGMGTNDPSVIIKQNILNANQGMTISFWIDLKENTYINQNIDLLTFYSIYGSIGPILAGASPAQGIAYHCGNGSCFDNGWLWTNVHPPLWTWAQVTYVYDSSTKSMDVFMDGKLIGSGAGVDPGNIILPDTTSAVIGGGYSGGGAPSANVIISNMQLYNTSLTNEEVSSLYLEGIGGAPINLQHLVAWYPLNGNSNDYSGNNYDGITANVIWLGTWWQGYSQP